jgi:SAM-dependent methyltransferase
MNIRKLVPDSDIRTWVGPFNDKEWYFNLGREQAEKIIKELSVKPHHKILDIGCGCGRIAIHFLDYLNKEGKYIGIDNSNPLLSYCTENISTINNNFQFHYIDVYNGAYAPVGKLSAREVIFPVEDNSVDSVIMWSVFTHMHLKDIDAYLKEIYRVLKKDGLFISSFNLYNKFTENRIKLDKSHLDIKYCIDEDSYSLDTEVPERGFAHSEEKVKEIYWNHGFLIKQINYGIWPCKEMTGEFHDYVIAQK